MTGRPSFLGALRASITAQRRPDDPVDTVPMPHHVVRLGEVHTACDQRSSWDAADAWCRAHVEHGAGHLWSRRIDRGPHHDQMVPVFTFSDPYTALWFKLAFR